MWRFHQPHQSSSFAWPMNAICFPSGDHAGQNRHARLRRQVLRLSARGRHDPHVAHDVVVVVVLRIPVGREREPLPVRGPNRRLVVVRAARQRLDLAGRDVEDVDVRASLRQESLAVELVAKLGNPHVTGRRQILLLVLRLHRLLERRASRQVPRLNGIVRREDERDLGAVGRPRQSAGATVEIREALGLATVQRQPVDLRLLVLTIGDEREPAAVRAERRARIPALAVGQPARLAARHRDHP